MITPSENDQESFVPIILLVDDTPENLKLLGEILVRKFNCELAMASNGQEALEAAQELKPDLILLDIMMPDMDGFEGVPLVESGSAYGGYTYHFSDCPNGHRRCCTGL